METGELSALLSSMCRNPRLHNAKCLVLVSVSYLSNESLSYKSPIRSSLGSGALPHLYITEKPNAARQIQGSGGIRKLQL